MDREALINEVIPLASACHAGVANDDERARLDRLLEDNAEARAIYLRIADDAVTLNDLHAARELVATANAKSPATTIRSTLLFTAIAASALAASVALAFAWRAGHDDPAAAKPPLSPTSAALASAHPASSSFARIVSLANVVWRTDSRVYHEWDRLGEGDPLTFDSGCIEVLYDNGVQFVVQGPADCTFTCEKKLMARSGKLVARVSPEAIGFKIVTPHTAVIDRGTSFGVTIDPDHQTDVVVYEGKVDLAFKSSSSKSSSEGDRRLQAGEALRIGQDGTLGRISSVASDAFLPPPQLGDVSVGGVSQLIDSVSDNLKASQTAKYYRVIAHGFREDCRAYVDRHHQWNGLDARGIPAFLQGADYVMTFNDDKVSADLRMAVKLAQPARLYILFDNRAEPPKWLADSFTDTGWDIGIDEGYDDVADVKTAVGAGKSIEHTLSVWAKDVAVPTSVLLGALREVKTSSRPREVENCMYGIAATPIPPAAASFEKSRSSGAVNSASAPLQVSPR